MAPATARGDKATTGWRSVAVLVGVAGDGDFEVGWPGVLTVRNAPLNRGFLVEPADGAPQPLPYPGPSIIVLLRAFLTGTGAGSLLWDVLPHRSMAAEGGATERVAPLFGELAWPAGGVDAHFLQPDAPPPLVSQGAKWAPIPSGVLESVRNVRPARIAALPVGTTGARIALSSSGTSAELHVAGDHAGGAEVRFGTGAGPTLELRLVGVDALRHAAAAVTELAAVMAASVLGGTPFRSAAVWLFDNRPPAPSETAAAVRPKRPAFLRDAPDGALLAAVAELRAARALGVRRCDALEFDAPLDAAAAQRVTLAGRGVMIEGSRAAADSSGDGGWPVDRLADMDHARIVSARIVLFRD